MQGTLWGKNSEKNVSQCRKKIERGTGMVCYAEKQGKPFWSSSLGQMVQFDTIMFGRTFKNYFGQFVWIEKKNHYNSRVSLHEPPTNNRRLLAFPRILCCNVANPVKVSASLLCCWTQWLVQPTSPTVILPRIPSALTGMQCSTSYRLSVSHTCVCTTGETLLKLCSTPSHA